MTRTAFEAYAERKGVCRDFSHLAVAFCRCMNIPARYANGFLGDIGVPPDPSPMDYSAWFEIGHSLLDDHFVLRVDRDLDVVADANLRMGGHRPAVGISSASPQISGIPKCTRSGPSRA
jgi:Transglutaminase-like superfamily